MATQQSFTRYKCKPKYIKGTQYDCIDRSTMKTINNFTYKEHICGIQSAYIPKNKQLKCSTPDAAFPQHHKQINIMYIISTHKTECTIYMNLSVNYRSYTARQCGCH